MRGGVALIQGPIRENVGYPLSYLSQQFTGFQRQNSAYAHVFVCVSLCVHVYVSVSVCAPCLGTRACVYENMDTISL